MAGRQGVRSQPPPVPKRGRTRCVAVREDDEAASVSRRHDPSLTVTFHKVDGRNGSPLAWWEAVRQTRGRIRGGYMPIGRGRIPHDLGHMATEAHLGIHDGFWGLLARGATFEHGTQQRRTRPGRQLIRDHRAALEAAEAIGNEHHFAWVAGQPTGARPDVRPSGSSLGRHSRWRLADRPLADPPRRRDDQPTTPSHMMTTPAAASFVSGRATMASCVSSRRSHPCPGSRRKPSEG